MAYSSTPSTPDEQSLPTTEELAAAVEQLGADLDDAERRIDALEAELHVVDVEHWIVYYRQLFESHTALSRVWGRMDGGGARIEKGGG